METARGLIATLAELTAGVENCEDDLNRRNAHSVLADWHSASVVCDSQTAVLVDSHIDPVTEA